MFLSSGLEPYSYKLLRKKFGKCEEYRMLRDAFEAIKFARGFFEHEVFEKVTLDEDNE